MKFNKKAVVIGGIDGVLAGGLSGALMNSMNPTLVGTIVMIVGVSVIVGTITYAIIVVIDTIRK